MKLAHISASAAIAACSSILAFSQNLLSNGSFETGNLSGWTTFVTTNGNLGSAYGLPNVVSFDVAGTGTPVPAAQFQVGEVVFNQQTLEGGGIDQSFNCAAGTYNISVQVAATNMLTLTNFQAGIFSLMMDGKT